jgi:hypothetical protein
LRFLVVEEPFFANWIILYEEWLLQDFKMVIGNCPDIERFTVAGDVSKDEDRRKHVFPGQIILGPVKPDSWSEAGSLNYHIEKLIGRELRERDTSLENNQIWRGGIQMISEDLYCEQL